MDQDPEGDQLRDRVAPAIAQAVGAGGEVLVRWVLVAEVVDPDGDRCLYSLAPPDTKSWDALGLLHYAIAAEQATLTADEIQDS